MIWLKCIRTLHRMNNDKLRLNVLLNYDNCSSHTHSECVYFNQQQLNSFHSYGWCSHVSPPITVRNLMFIIGSWNQLNSLKCTERPQIMCFWEEISRMTCKHKKVSFSQIMRSVLSTKLSSYISFRCWNLESHSQFTEHRKIHNHVIPKQYNENNSIFLSICSQRQACHLTIMLLGGCQCTKERMPQQQHTVLHQNGVLRDLLYGRMQRCRSIWSGRLISYYSGCNCKALGLVRLPTDRA